MISAKEMENIRWSSASPVLSIMSGSIAASDSLAAIRARACGIGHADLPRRLDDVSNHHLKNYVSTVSKLRKLASASRDVLHTYIVHHYHNGIIGAGVMRSTTPEGAAGQYMIANGFDYTPDSVFKVVSVETGRIDWVGYERIKG